MPFPISQENQNDYQMSKSVMDTPRSVWKKVTDFLVGRGPVEQFNNTFSGNAFGAITAPAGKAIPGVMRGSFVPSWGRKFSAQEPVDFVQGQFQKHPNNAEGTGTGFLNTRTGMGAYANHDHMHEDLGKALLQQGVDPESFKMASRIRWNPSGNIDFIPPNLPETLSTAAKTHIESKEYDNAYRILSDMGMIPPNKEMVNRGYFSGVNARFRDYDGIK
jgi:hypothetical protein